MTEGKTKLTEVFIQDNGGKWQQCKVAAEVEQNAEVLLRDKDGKWHQCKPLVATVKGGKAVIYVAPDGTEIKREPLARYRARETKKAQDTQDTSIDVRVKEIVEAIVDDISDRRGLKREWAAIDEVIQEDIKETWAGIIKNKLMA